MFYPATLIKLVVGTACVVTGSSGDIQDVTLASRDLPERKAPASRVASQTGGQSPALREASTDMNAQRLLGGLSVEEVTRIINDSMGRPAMPYLRDPKVRDRAIEIAGKQALLQRIEKGLATDKPIPVLSYSAFREFRRNGNRTNYEKLLEDRDGRQSAAVMACYLGMDRLRYLQDLMWADCEASWWQLPAHEGPAKGKDRPIDLWVAMKAAQLAITLDLLQDRIEPEVRDRVLREIRRRAIDEFFNPDAEFWWKTGTNNWNAVCHGGVGIAALLVEKDPQRLARLITQTLEELPAFLSGFTDDGGCNEGPGYWTFGFGWYVDLACALYDFTGGKINIMADPKVERICRYPLAVSIRPGQNLPFSDTEQGFVPANLAIRINRFYKVPELYGLCKLTDDGSLAMESLADLMLYDGTKYRPLNERADAFLPDLGVARIRSGRVTVGAKAGHNAESHNHNDVGSFVIHKGKTFFLTDPGAPIYSARTFSPQRYDSIFCNSFGHGVPVINGQLQPEGRQFAGTIQADGLNTSGAKTIRIEMARAYDVPSLKGLSRTIELAPDGRQVTLSDRFWFSSQPESLEEAFIAILPAKVAEDGKSVIVQSEADGALRLRVDGTTGTFRVAELKEESKESPVGDLLRRISFRPAQLKPEMTLRFVVTFE